MLIGTGVKYSTIPIVDKENTRYFSWYNYMYECFDTY